MKVRSSLVVLLVGLLALALPQVVHADMKLAILKVKGMVCQF